MCVLRWIHWCFLVYVIASIQNIWKVHTFEFMLLLFMVCSACFLFKTFIIVLSEFTTLWQATRSFFVKFTPILFSNFMTTSSRITWGISRSISAISTHSLESCREYCSSLWTYLSSSVILKVLEFRFSWSAFVVFSATIILLRRISLSLASL